MKPFIVVQGPVATRSGYGNHTRDLVTALIMAQASEEDKPALKEALKTVPATIDIIVAATKGEVDINQVAKVASSCLPCCFKLFSKK